MKNGIYKILIFLVSLLIFSCGTESETLKKSTPQTEEQTTASEETDSETTDSETTDSEQTTVTTVQANTETKTDVWTESQDFNASDWSVNIQIPAEKFTDFAAGSAIQVEWNASSTATDYKKLQFDAMTAAWTELTGGTFSGGSTDSDKGVKPEASPVSYIVTAANASSLKSNGLALMGYGVVVTKITLVTGGSASSGGNPAAGRGGCGR